MFIFILKVKVQAYSLISSLKTYQPTFHCTPWSLDLFIPVPFQLHGEHTVLQPFRRIKLIVHHGSRTDMENGEKSLYVYY